MPIPDAILLTYIGGSALPRDIPNETLYSESGAYLKTAAMQSLETEINLTRNHAHPEDPNYIEIHELLLDALRHHGTDRLAANSLGLLPSTFSQWINRCGVALQAARIRTYREKKVNQWT